MPADHPLRATRQMCDEALRSLTSCFAGLYSPLGRRSIAPEKLLRALLLQVLYTIRSERMLMEQMEYNLLFRWFVGLSMDETVWDASHSRTRGPAQPLHSPGEISVDLGNADTRERVAARFVSEPLKKHAGGTAVPVENTLRKTVNIDQPATIAVEQFALKPLTVVSCRFLRRPVRIQHSKQTADRAGIPSSQSRRVPRLSAAPSSGIQFHLNKAIDVLRPGMLCGDT